MNLKNTRWLAAAGALALAAVGTAAQARDVYWSVGINAAPGVSVGVANVPPVYVAPQPVYVAPAPVYYARPAPVYYGYSGYYHHRHGKHRGKGHHKHWR